MSERTYQIRSLSDVDALRIIILGTLGDHKKESANEIAQAVNEIVDKNKPVKVFIDCTGFIGRLRSRRYLRSCERAQTHYSYSA